MSPSTTHAVTVRIPATSANLGPGFDAVGLAVSLFFVLMLWAAILHDCTEKLAWLLGSIGAVVALIAPLQWAYAEGGKAAIRGEPTGLVVGAAAGCLSPRVFPLIMLDGPFSRLAILTFLFA